MNMEFSTNLKSLDEILTYSIYATVVSNFLTVIFGHTLLAVNGL